MDAISQDETLSFFFPSLICSVPKMSGGDERDSKSSKSFDLLTRYLYIVSQAEHNRG